MLFIYKTPITNVRWDQFIDDVRYYLTQPPYNLSPLTNLSKVEEEEEDMDMGNLNNTGDDNLNDSVSDGGEPEHNYIVSYKPLFSQKITILNIPSANPFHKSVLVLSC